MAQTPAQKKAAADAANRLLLAKAEAALSKSKAKLSSLQNPKGATVTQDYVTRNVGFEATGAIRTPEQISAILNPTPTPAAPVDSGFPKSGKILRYKAGSKSGFVIPVFADGAGGEFDGEEVPNPAIIGSEGYTPGGKVPLSTATFRNTMSTIMGGTNPEDIVWLDELQEMMQGFINTGSTPEEAQNLALNEAKAKGKASPFVQRFDAVFRLQDRLKAGEAIDVPTIAEYVKSEQALGTVFRDMGLGELANQKTISKILGEAGKSVAEATRLISNVFSTIDNAPKALKDDLAKFFPGVDRTSIAKAILLGKEGALELEKKVASIEQFSAAKSQGVNIDLATGAELAAGGATYGTSLANFGTVKNLERGQMLGRANAIDFTQQEAINATFKQDVAAQEKIRQIQETEIGKFRGSAGTAGSKSLASKSRATAI